MSTMFSMSFNRRMFYDVSSGGKWDFYSPTFNTRQPSSAEGKSAGEKFYLNAFITSLFPHKETRDFKYSGKISNSFK